MSKIISELLGAKEPLFTMSIKQLEQASGNPSADVRLTAEIIGAIRMKTIELGLDPNDTSPRELHSALLAKIEEHNNILVKKIGGKPDSTPAELMPLIRRAWEKFDAPKDCWVLKKTVAKTMLKKMPPKQIMKHLGYRSVDSMLKHENLGEIYGALRFAESPEWLNDFNGLYKSLKPTDFVTRQIEIIEMPIERWGDLAAPFIHKKRHNITHLKELGIILMLPISPKVNLRGIAIFTLPLLFHYLQEIRLYSTFFKAQQVKPNFGNVVVETLIADPSNAAIIVGKQIHWRVIQRYFGKLDEKKFTKIFEPHVQPEDLHWRRASEFLQEFEPALKFWRDLDYVGVVDKDKRPVVLNMYDVAATYVTKTPYADRTIYHFRDALWNEIFVRYMGQKNLEEQILAQLDNDTINPASLKI